MKHDVLCERGRRPRPFDCGCGLRAYMANPYLEWEDPLGWSAPAGVNLNRWWVSVE